MSFSKYLLILCAIFLVIPFLMGYKNSVSLKKTKLGYYELSHNSIRDWHYLIFVCLPCEYPEGHASRKPV